MERERYRFISATLRRAAAATQHHNPRLVHSDALIVRVALWAALHDQPIVWATHRAHWPGDLRPRRLPSQSCMSRRLRTDAVRRLLHEVQHTLRQQLPRHDVHCIDARPLCVGGASKDPDATLGYGAGLRIKGYKLHLVVDFGGAVDGWVVAPANVPEQHIATHLIAHSRPARWLMADGNYDSNQLYDLADERGTQLLAQPRGNIHPPRANRNSPARLRVHRYLNSPIGRRTMRQRIRIEQINARLGCSSVRLHHLPHHARRLHRVTLWVALKILLLTELQIRTQPRAA